MTPRTVQSKPTSGAASSRDRVPLVAHVIHSFAMGGLENGLVNLINRMDEHRFRHAIVCMLGSSDYSRRIRRGNVEVHTLHRGTVPMWRTYFDLAALFRKLRPAIVHTRNLSGLDALLPAYVAGVRVRIHGEHGRDMDDLDGSNPHHRRLKRLFRPLISHYSAVSEDLAQDLVRNIAVPPARVTQIYNGVDTEIFRPRTSILAGPAAASSATVGPAISVGTVGRLQPVKDQVSLLRAFAQARSRAPDLLARSSLQIVGEGPCRPQLEAEIERLRLADCATLLGARHDVPDIMRSLDIFVLPSLAEGISNTLLEAMVSGVPIIATSVGGNTELVEAGRTGVLVRPGDCDAMADEIVRYASDPVRRAEHGRAARQRTEERFSLASMVNAYADLYDSLIGRQLAGQPCRPGVPA